MGKAMMYICVVFGFNRYIVECKVKLTEAKNNLAKRFNRYIVECKALSDAAITGAKMI